MNKKSILIIGSSGFFGKSILDYILDNKKIKKKIGKIFLLSRKNKNKIHPSLSKDYKIIKIQCDISKAKSLPFADYIIYCVISKNLKDDFQAAKNYVKLAKKFHKGSTILYTSSGAVYGDQLFSVKKLSEKHFPNPSNHKSKSRKDYAIIKYKNEKLFKSLINNNIKVTIARCFAFVGRNLPMDKNFVVGNLIKNILDKKKLVIKSDKKVFRSYMLSNDLSYCLLKLIFNNDKKFNIYNIGSEDKVDIRDLARKLGKKFKLEVNFNEIKEKNKYDLYIPKISKFRKKYKFYKKLDSYDAVIKTIKDILKYGYK